jgi:hypothetical protein
MITSEATGKALPVAFIFALRAEGFDPSAAKIPKGWRPCSGTIPGLHYPIVFKRR